VIQRLLTQRTDLVASISMTTRPPRPGEQEGVHYFFVTREEFESHIQAGAMLEWAKVYENYYGTPKPFLEIQFAAGRDVIIEIDVQGAASARMHYPDGLFIYILPPSIETLKERLFSRAKGEGDQLEQRLALATHEFQFLGMYDYVVINDDLATAVQEVETIILADRLRRRRQAGRLRELGFFSSLS
jgi:guanylate kinase